MKTLKLIGAGIMLIMSGVLTAQVSVSVNIGTPPLWGPVGYTDLRYYYLPDVEAYYDIPSSMFIYFDGGVWVHRASLPGRYRNYDLYNGYKVVMTDYRDDAPYSNFKEHKIKYGKGFHGGPQKTIGQRPGNGNSGMKNEGKGHSNEMHKEGNQRNESQGKPQGNENHGEKEHGHGGGKK